VVPVTGKQSLVQLCVYGAIALAAVLGAVILGYHGTLNSDAVAAILTGALALAGASAAGQGAVYQAVNGKSVVTPQLIAEQGASQRTAIVAAAAGTAADVTPVEPTPPPAEDA
jgi:hypothetical protein